MNDNETWEWIRVEDQLPDDDCLVLTCTNEHSFSMGCHDDDGWWMEEPAVRKIKNVTHWCHPVPPTQENNK